MRRLSDLRPGDRLHHDPVDEPVGLLEEQSFPWQSQTLGRYAPLRRSLIKLTPTQLFVDWACQQPDCEDITLEHVRTHDSLCFLMPLHAAEALDGAILRRHWPRFFAQMLETVAADPECWPSDRSWALFHRWFDIEHLGDVLDIADAIASPEEVEAMRAKSAGVVATLTQALRRLTRWRSGDGAKQPWSRSRRERAMIHQQNRGVRRTCSYRPSSF